MDRRIVYQETRKVRMQIVDDALENFEKHGALPLPPATVEGFVENDGARIWHATHGAGPPVILLHGGLGNAGNWGYQVPALVTANRTVVVIDSRGHGRSTRDAGRPHHSSRCQPFCAAAAAGAVQQRCTPVPRTMA
jgi:alpha-beta hydrolase superfamily lysophospholipase